MNIKEKILCILSVISFSMMFFALHLPIANADSYEITQITDNGYWAEHLRMNANGQIVWVGRYDNGLLEVSFYDGFSVERLNNDNLTDNYIVGYDPQVGENGYVIWTARVGPMGNSDIFLVTGHRIPKVGYLVTRLSPESENNYLQINASGQAVWQGCDFFQWGNDDWEIFFYNGSSTIQLTDNDREDERPQISDNGHVVWVRSDGGDDEIFRYDGTSVTQLTDNDSRDNYPQINANGHIIWIGRYLTNNDAIFLYDGVSVTRIADSGGGSEMRINALGHVVWTEHDGNDNEVYLYDGSSVRQITDNDYNDAYPQINALGHVVWQGFDGDDYEIFAFNSNTIIQLTDNSEVDIDPQINGPGNILWREQHFGGNDRIMFATWTEESNDDPQIMSISPKTAFPGQLITVRGSNFVVGENPTRVMFDDETIVLIEESFDTEFSFYLPAHIKTGTFRVITPNGESNTVELNVIPASVTLDLDGTGKNEGIMHFRLDKGIRVWDEDERTWGKLHDLNPEFLAKGNILRTAAGEQDIIIDFGPEIGLQVRHADKTWTKLHYLSPEKIISADINADIFSEAIIDFGPGKGVRAWTGQWEFIYGEGTECMAAGDINDDGWDEVIMGIREGGIKIRDHNGRINGLHEMCPEIIAVGDVNSDNYDEVIVYFEGHGIYIYYPEPREWKKLHDVPVESVTIGQIDGDLAGRSDIVIDFGQYGIKIWCNDTEWKKLHDLDPEWILIGDLDNSGQDDIIIDFGDGKGLWVWDNDSRWRKLHELSP